MDVLIHVFMYVCMMMYVWVCEAGCMYDDVCMD